MQVSLNLTTVVLIMADSHRDAGTRALGGETAVQTQRQRLDICSYESRSR